MAPGRAALLLPYEMRIIIGDMYPYYYRGYVSITISFLYLSIENVISQHKIKRKRKLKNNKIVFFDL